MKLYPLKFKPILKHRIWGGTKLNTILNKKSNHSNIGESWEISDVDEDISIIINGCYKNSSLKALLKKYKAELVGNKVYNQFGDKFPLLIKFIDAQKPLSIQVHPNNKFAKENHNAFGKNEMWYILNAEENAEIIVGFKKPIDKNTFKSKITSNEVLDILNVENAKPGDVFYIPTGRIHAIGSGVLLAEIQQTSDITYRVYDYDRVDKNTGKKRELHIENALKVINFEDVNDFKTVYNIIDNVPSKLLHTPYFKTNLLTITNKIQRNLEEIDSFKIYMCVEGKVTYLYNNHTGFLNFGETILVPNSIKSLQFQSKNAKLIEIYY